MHTTHLRQRPTALVAGWLGLLLGVFVVAFAVRLLTVLRGGGLYGIIGYDGSVYYTAAAGLVHGLLPYQDFLLLHPPGIILALLPFAALGRLIGDPHAFAVARIAWMGLGGLNAVLVSRILRSYGVPAALTGGLLYAVFVPAVYSEHSTSLEAVGSTCLLGALWILFRAGRTQTASPRAFVLAGLLVGVATGTKIWGVVIVLALVGWAVASAGVGRAARLLGGAVLGATLICLPFFLTSPATMWRMIVVDQLGRREVPVSLGLRLLGISGLSQIEMQVRHDGLLLILGLLAAVVIAVLAVRQPLGRLAAVLVMVTCTLLVLIPSWSLHYTGLAAPAIALLVGSAVASIDQLLGSVRTRLVLAGVVVVALVGYSLLSLPTLTFGSPFRAQPLAAALARTPGCLTSDDPTVLIETNSLGRNLSRNCPLVTDLGGYSYDLQPGASRQTGRSANGQWQNFARAYLSSGSATVVARFRTAPGYSKATKKIIAQWPVLARSGKYVLQKPTSVTPTGR